MKILKKLVFFSVTSLGTLYCARKSRCKKSLENNVQDQIWNLKMQIKVIEDKIRQLEKVR